MPKPFFFIDSGAEVTFNAASGDSKTRSISITAYKGGKLKLKGVPHPVVVDLDGLSIEATIPFLIDHTNKITHTLGQGKAVRRGNILYAEGTLTGSGQLAKDVAQNAELGHVYQASVGVNPSDTVFVPAGHSIQANGMTHKGPLLFAKKSELIEVSAVNIGADRDGTEFNIAATFGLDVQDDSIGRKEIDMDPKLKAWLEASLGLDEAAFTALSEDKQTKIQATFEASVKVDNIVVKEDDDKSAVIKASADAELAATVAGLTEEVRIGKIEAACGDNFADLKATAIEKNWTVETVNASIEQINKVRADRPAAPGVLVPGDVKSASVIEAGLALAYSNLTQDDLLASYGEETLDKADKYRNCTLKEVMAASCHIDGVAVPGIGSSPAEWAASAFSTRTFPNVLSNLANKSLMESFGRRESVAAMVSRKLTANDFKIQTQTRISAGGGMKKLENGGEIQHGTIEDVARTFSLDTYAEMLGLTRQDIINDNLGAFTAIPEQLGFDAWQLRENLFWTLVLANTDDFFGTGNANLSTGSGSALGLAGLAAAKTLMEKQVDEKGRAIQVTPDFLLTPSELSAVADGLYVSDKIVSGNTTATVDKNIYNGKYRPLSTPFLSNALITGYSATAWYLFADPRVTPAFGISYLNGRETPFIEETDPDPRYLGRVFRSYYDVGVAQMEPKGAVKSTGAA